MAPEKDHKAGMTAFDTGADFDRANSLAWRNGYRLAWFIAGCPITLNKTPIGE